MSARQYERCEHPRGSGMMGSDPDEFYPTPCPQCQAATRLTSREVFGLLVLTVLLAWWALS